MSRVFVRQVTGVAVSTPFYFGNFSDNFSLGLGTFVSGTGTYTIEYAFDDPTASGFAVSTSSTGCSGTWFPVSGVSGVAVKASAFFTSPFTMMRINNNTASAGFQVTCSCLQTGPSCG